MYTHSMLFYLMSQDLSGVTGLIMFFGYILAVVIAISLHEFSHAYVAYKFGDPTAKNMGRLTLNPLAHFEIFGLISFLLIGFGWAKPVPVNPARFKNFKAGSIWVSLSGVLTNIALAFISSLILVLMISVFQVHTTDVGNAFVSVVNLFTLLNIALAVFNFLPIYPLDGFNFLRAILKPTNSFLIFMLKYGMFILIGLIVTGLFGFIINVVSVNILKGFLAFWNLFIP